MSVRTVALKLEAHSFEPAQLSERLTSRRAGWPGAATEGSIPVLVTFFFSLSSSSSLSLLSFETYISLLFTIFLF